MFQRKPGHEVKKVVWRMSEDNPIGEFVAPGSRPHKATGAPEIHDRWFRMSSMDLAKGSEVSETELAQLPGDLLDAFKKTP